MTYRFSPYGLKKLFLNSNPTPLPGQINYHQFFYRNTASVIDFPLSVLFRSFLDLRDLPDEWRQAIITPKFKKGTPSDVSNYRPIALTCTACKILESLISCTLLDFLHLHNLISKQQHGFLKNHSTSTNLLSSLNDVHA